MKKTILGVIGARGGSKGVPGKNIMPVAGKPLIGWGIERALASGRITDLVVSTDDAVIAQTAEKFGAKVPFLRPAELAVSTAGKFGVWKHALTECEKIYKTSYDILLDMDCTTPLLDAQDLNGIIDSFEKEGDGVDGMFTVTGSHRNPYFNLVEESNEGFLKLSKTLPGHVEARQAAPKTWDIVAGYYIFHSGFIRAANYFLDGRMKGYVVPREKSFDIDEPFDAVPVDWLMRRQHGL